MRLESSGGFTETLKFLKKAKEMDIQRVLNKYGEAGVNLLASATPKRTGKTASSWTYEIEKKGKTYTIYWNNSNVNKGVNIALILQLGHGTRNGGYVNGIDYINPAMQPLFSQLADSAWKELIS